jgi:hypothetical protein
MYDHFRHTTVHWLPYMSMLQTVFLPSHRISLESQSVYKII